MRGRIFIISIFLLFGITNYASASEQGVTLGPFSKDYIYCCSEKLDLEKEEELRVPQSELRFPIAELSDRVFEHLINRENTFEITITKEHIHTGEQIEQALLYAIKQALHRDEELRYDMGAYSYKYTFWDHKVIFTLQVQYGQTKEQVEFVERAVKRLVPQIITPEMNDHEKVKAVHDYIILNTEYDMSINQKNNNPYAALTLQKTLCGGYSRLAALLLNEAGVETRVISGYSRNVGHAWNLVKVDNIWYHLDITWDDPVPDKLGRIQYDYFLLPSEVIQKTHEWQNGGLNKRDTPYPEANTYYEDEMLKQGKSDWLQSIQLLSYKIEEEEEIIPLLQQGVRDQKESVTILLPTYVSDNEAIRELQKFVNSSKWNEVTYSIGKDYSRYLQHRPMTVYLTTKSSSSIESLLWSQPLKEEYALHTSAPFRVTAIFTNGEQQEVTLQSAFTFSSHTPAYRLGSQLHFNELGTTTVTAYYEGKEIQHTFTVVEQQEPPLSEKPSEPNEEPTPMEPENIPIPEFLEGYEPIFDERDMPLTTEDSNKVWTLILNDPIAQPVTTEHIQVVNANKEPIDVTINVHDQQQVQITPSDAYNSNELYYILIERISNEQNKKIERQFVSFQVVDDTE